MKKTPFYITTTLPYVNAEPHIGFALEIVQADIIARYQRLLGHEVFFNTGTDEHGQKVYQKAKEEGKDTQKYTDEYAARFQGLKKTLNLSYDNFIRTTDSRHKEAAQEFWKRCDKNGDIYKKNYELKYCVGCELEKSDSDLIAGRCILHPNAPIEIRQEENYFFRFSKYGKKLLMFYRDNPDFVLPQSRLNEMTAFIERGLTDFSISRLKEKMPWGVEVPGDASHVMYVWFDALVNYISALGWPEDEKNFQKFWGTTETPNAVQVAGKDNLRQQSAMWVAMLFSAKLPPPKQIVIHGFITSQGEKMSKSLGNVVNPKEIVKEYGADALRYYLAREITPFEDGDFTAEKFKEAYNANLANGLGNLTSRIMKLAATTGMKAERAENEEVPESALLDKFEISKAMDGIWGRIQTLDANIQKTEPWKKIKTDEAEAKKDIKNLLDELYSIALELRPFLPGTAEKIIQTALEGKMPEPLFLRK